MTTVKNVLGPVAKALTGAIATGVATGAVAAADDRITTGEWWTIAAATLGALAAVWAVPNTPSDDYQGEHEAA